MGIRIFAIDRLLRSRRCFSFITREADTSSLSGLLIAPVIGKTYHTAAVPLKIDRNALECPIAVPHRVEIERIIRRVFWCHALRLGHGWAFRQIGRGLHMGGTFSRHNDIIAAFFAFDKPRL
jgi:hypothetical protein